VKKRDYKLPRLAQTHKSIDSTSLLDYGD